MALSTDDIELALSLGVDPDDSGPLSTERRAELEASLASSTEAESAHDQAVGNAVDQDAIALATEQIMARLAAAGGGAALQPSGNVTIADVLQQIDPADSEAHLAILQLLFDHGRMQVIGSLNGGGYLMHYAEPKGSSKAGYMPGATQGGRMVDQAVDKAKASGAKPRKTGMCDKCWSAVEQHDDGSITEDGSTNVACPAGGAHTFNA